MLKATLEGISSGKQSPLYEGPYTPEQVGIKDLNDDSTSVSMFKKTIVNPKTGECETYECTHMKKTVDIYNEKYKYVNDKSRFSSIQNYLIEKTLKTAGWDKTLCVKMHLNTPWL